MKLWKKPARLHRRLRQLGYKGEFKRIKMASWKNAACQQAHMAMPNAWFKEIGLYHPPQLETGQLSLLLVYMVLACQYESLRDPLVVMLSTPMAAFGVLLTLWLTNTTLNLQSAIGCIMLGGIVVNNAILLVDQAGRLVEEGYTLHDAVIEAGRRRFRPILMTTLTTILGLLPLALGLGEGSDAQAPLARAVVGGLSGSTVITLVLIPVVYTLAHGKSRKENAA
jgi:HAE1 family hydrophobic/amphiphilic exporter-1